MTDGKRTESNDAFNAWLTAAKTGSQDDLGRVLETCRGYLLAMAEAELGSTLRPKAGASDLVQDSLLEAQKGFEHFRGSTGEEFLAWVGHIMKNNVADLGRKFRSTQRREIGREGSLHAESPGTISAPSDERPIDLLTAAEDASQLHAAIARLPAETRDIISWRHQDRLSWDEIGRLIDKTPEAARKVWFRALERLREELDGNHGPTR